MYKIIGADGREYGPASAEQIRQWVTEGRAHAQTLTQAAGSAEWKPLASFPELIQQAPVPTAPAVASPNVLQSSTNSSAIAGLVMGLLSLTFGWLCCIPLFSILGIIFSSRGLSQINRNPLQETGKGMAVAGLILSILGLVAPFVFAMLLAASGMAGRHPFYWRWHRTW